jgi:hypothetical protein
VWVSDGLSVELKCCKEGIMESKMWTFWPVLFLSGKRGLRV